MIVHVAMSMYLKFWVDNGLVRVDVSVSFGNNTGMGVGGLFTSVSFGMQ